MVTPLTVVQAQAIAAMRDDKPQESLHQIQQMVLICIYDSIDFNIILTFPRNCCVLLRPPERPQSKELRGSLMTTKLRKGRRIVGVSIQRFNLRSSRLLLFDRNMAQL